MLQKALTHRLRPAVTRGQRRTAFAAALLADVLQLGLFPLFGEGVLSPFQDALDVTVALVMLLTLGFRWRTLFAFGIELVPGLALFPSWTAMVASLDVREAEPALSIADTAP